MFESLLLSFHSTRANGCSDITSGSPNIRKALIRVKENISCLSFIHCRFIYTPEVVALFFFFFFFFFFSTFATYVMYTLDCEAILLHVS